MSELETPSDTTVHAASEMHHGHYVEGNETFNSFKKQLMEDGKNEWMRQMRLNIRNAFLIALFGFFCWMLGYASHG